MGKDCCASDEPNHESTIKELENRTSENPDKAHRVVPSGRSSPSASPKSEGERALTIYLPAIVSFTLLVLGVIFSYLEMAFFQGFIKFLWFSVAYLLVGGQVLKYAWINILKGQVFNEFLLMGIATLGAFYLGEYPEGVAVMLFYVIGEHFQGSAVKKSRKSIKDLIDNRPLSVHLLQGGKVSDVYPETVAPGDIIQMKPGERAALDGLLLTDEASFNSSALTGESIPDLKRKGEKVLAGMINLNKVIEIRVTALFEDSALSKILKLVETATSRKAKTQKFITKFAKVYTPIVVFLAVGITLIPYLVLADYDFEEWFYRALVFLVISCPCALVVSIPLGYFGGIGAGSRNGILFKGSNYLDLVTQLDTVVMDKTGTLTKGVFNVQKVCSNYGDETDFVNMVAALEKHSTHPIAEAIIKHTGKERTEMPVTDVEEFPGYGLKGAVVGKQMLVGNLNLLKRFGIAYPISIEDEVETIVAVAIDEKFAGYITIADELKEDALLAIHNLKKLGIKDFVILSGDKPIVVESIAQKLGIRTFYGGLLPEEKVEKVEALKKEGRMIGFVGDGINDAPVITLADVGFAMGGLGSDAAIETADVVIQNDQPSKIATAISIGKKTKEVVWQNISLAFGVKAIVLILGAGGLASMWEAVFADVGVALLAILNAIRIQKIKF